MDVPLREPSKTGAIGGEELGRPKVNDPCVNLIYEEGAKSQPLEQMNHERNFAAESDLSSNSDQPRLASAQHNPEFASNEDDELQRPSL